MKKYYLIPVAIFLFTACAAKVENVLVNDNKADGFKAELTIDGLDGHLSVQYPPSSQWKQISEDVKIIKNTYSEIEIQRPDGVKLNFVRAIAPFVCSDCDHFYPNQIPIVWYKKA